MAYKGVIATDCWHEPYMPMADLKAEVASGVRFVGYEEGGELLGVMGLQDVKGVALIRHAYVRSDRRRQGIGSRLLQHLLAQARPPVLVGTWSAAIWAVRFYEKHGFSPVSRQESERLLREYWTISERQIEESVVLIKQEIGDEP